MPASVLIPPDNRLLGWSLGDLTLYGAQPSTGVAFARASDGGTASGTAPVPTGDAPTPVVGAPDGAESDRAADETTALLDRDDAQPPLPSSAPLSIPVDHAAATDAAGPAPATTPVGSGGFLQPMATPLQVADGAHASPAGAQPDVVGGGAPAGLTAPLAPVAHAADALTAIDLNTNIDVVQATVASLGDTLGAGVGTVDTVVADLGITDLLPSVTDGIGDVGTLVDLTPITAFAGTDPAAGLQTLIGMVESSEIFDLGHATSPVVELASAGSILDSLAADEAPAALLGDEDGGIDHVLDDHGIHLGI